MHVVIVDTTMTTPPTGGAHTFLVDLCAPLKERGWRASFVTQPGPEQGIVKALPEAGGGRLAAWVNDVRPDAYVISASPDAGWLALPLLDAGVPTLSVAHDDV